MIKAFPLKDTEYVLRFQYPISLASKKIKPVWLDVGKNVDVPCPDVNGKIIIKALRLPPRVLPNYHGALQKESVQKKAPEQPAPQKNTMRDSVPIKTTTTS